MPQERNADLQVYSENVVEQRALDEQTWGSESFNVDELIMGVGIYLLPRTRR
jgi:hypothetical protein